MTHPDRADGRDRDPDQRGVLAWTTPTTTRRLGALLIRHSKNGRSRLLPLHPSTSDALHDYQANATRPAAPGRGPADRRAAGRPPTASASDSAVPVSATFRQLLARHRHHRRGRAAGTAAARPATHLRRRHPARLAARRPAGPARLPALSAYLGHVNPRHTYWYLQAVPDLLTPLVDKLEPTSQQTAGSGEATVVTALAPVLQGFFTDRLAALQRQPAHRRRLPRHLHGCCCASPSSACTRRPAELDLAELDADPGRRVPATTSKTERGNSSRDPQPAADRDPLAVPLRRPALPRARRHASPGSWPSRPSAATAPLVTLPHPTRGATRCSPPRTATTWHGRRDHAAAHRSLSQTGLRVTELTGLHRRRRPPRHRRRTSLPGKGRTGTRHPADPQTAGLLSGLARRTQPPAPPTRCSPPSTGRPALPRRRRTTSSPSTRHRRDVTARA